MFVSEQELCLSITSFLESSFCCIYHLLEVVRCFFELPLLDQFASIGLANVGAAVGAAVVLTPLAEQGAVVYLQDTAQHHSSAQRTNHVHRFLKIHNQVAVAKANSSQAPINDKQPV